MTQTITTSPSGRPDPDLCDDLDIRSRLEERLHDLTHADDRRVRAIHRVEVALAWHRGRTYGCCSICTEPLPAEQLRRDPADIVCGACRGVHERRRERNRKQPVPTSAVSLRDGLEAVELEFRRARAAHADGATASAPKLLE